MRRKSLVLGILAIIVAVGVGIYLIVTTSIREFSEAFVTVADSRGGIANIQASYDTNTVRANTFLVSDPEDNEVTVHFTCMRRNGQAIRKKGLIQKCSHANAPTKVGQAYTRNTGLSRFPMEISTSLETYKTLRKRNNPMNRDTASLV